jgi:outer membrane protein TolC
VLAGLTPPSFFVRVARRVALHVQSILLGDAAGTLPVAITDQERLTINLGTARAIDVWPPWGVLTEAEVIRPERADVPRRLELVTAVREAVQVNLDLAAAERTVAAGAATVREARSPLLPQIEASLTGLLIDADRAASLGAPAERTLRAGGSLSQLIYADGPWAGLAVERHLQTGRELERQTLRLDIAQAAATAYLEVLRAKTFERIQRENLELTRANLEQARVRATIGQAGPEEVYRWESQIATNRRTAIQANARRNLAEIELNRILNRPLEEPFATVEVDLRDPALLSGHAQFDRWLRSPWSFRVLRRVLVDEGLAASPELGRVDAAIAARERAQAAARRAFWLPTVGLQGEVSHLLAEDGAGSEDLDLSGLPVAIPGLEEPDDTDWSVALGATLPLIEGGGRRATLARTSEELERLRLERAALAERVEQRIRSTLHVAGASYASIEQTELAAAAARRNLELVQDAYAQGVVSILDLLDAQNAALVADQAASTAVHDFLIDLMAVERALGRLDVLRTAEEREAWIATVDRALAEARRRDEAP